MGSFGRGYLGWERGYCRGLRLGGGGFRHSERVGGIWGGSRRGSWSWKNVVRDWGSARGGRGIWRGRGMRVSLEVLWRGSRGRGGGRGGMEARLNGEVGGGGT